MNTFSFRLSAVALSVLFGFSAAAQSASTIPIAVPDVNTLNRGADSQYIGGGAVFIGGPDLVWNKDGLTGAAWQPINTQTPGFDALVRASGHLGYLDPNAQVMGFDPNYLIHEGYERTLHGQRLAQTLSDVGHSRPAGVVNGLRMGTAGQRYTKVQSVTLYQRDASGNILYQKDVDGVYVVDKNGYRIPLTVSQTITVDRNADVYIRPVASAGGDVGLVDAQLYSKVKSFTNDVVGAVQANGNLRENGWNGHARDVLVIKNSVIDNTLAEDATRNNPASENDWGDPEQHYNERPHAVGMVVNHNSVTWQKDANDQPVEGSEILTHQVAATPNVILENATITAQNLAAVREDSHTRNNNANYSRHGDVRSTALKISGSGQFISVTNSSLTGGVNGAGKSLTLSGHANRADVTHSALKGDVLINHDGYKPTLTVNVKRETNGNYTAVSASGDATLLQRSRNGNTLNIKESVIDGSITAAGSTGFEIALVDVTNDNAHVPVTSATHPTLQGIYNNAISSADQAVIANTGHDWTPVTVNMDHSTLNGRVTGTTAVKNPQQYAHDKYERVVTWNPDLNVKNSVWNAAARGDMSGRENRVSNLHDLNLSASTLNMVNLNTVKPTLGDRKRYEDLSTARVVVHHDLLQDKDAQGNYLASTINVGKGIVEPLLDIGGHYIFGSLQVKGSSHGQYWLNMASSGIEPYAQNGYVADRLQESASGKGHSFVNYQNSNSDAQFTGRTELGVYQYIAVNEYDDRVHDERNVYFKRNGQLSNSAATALSLPAAQADIATLESDALAKHLNASRRAKDDGGVWLAYYGGKNQNRVDASARYSLNTHGVMLGMDNRFDAVSGGNWLAGVSFNSGRSSLSVMNSSGDLDSYGAQFYLSRRYENGLFLDSQAQFNHFSNSADVRMLNGGHGRGSFASNGYGLGAKVGYAWEQDDYFVEPYAKATARTFDGGRYSLSNGMVVNANDYKSMLGELGVDLGYTFNINEGFVKPYLHLAGVNEFASSNQTRLNNSTLNNSVNGAALQVGLGADVQVIKNLGGYAAFDYTKGGDIERPWQATVGVNYSW